VKKRDFFERSASRAKKAPSTQTRGLEKVEVGFFWFIWQMSLLEVEEKGLRRPPTPLEAFKHHLASQPRIFVEQVLKVCSFSPLFFYLLPWTV